MNEAGELLVLSRRPLYACDVRRPCQLWRRADRMELSNPVTERWWASHLVPAAALEEDRRRRNAALQRTLAEQRRLMGKTVRA